MKSCIELPDEWLPTLTKFAEDWKDIAEFVRYEFLVAFASVLDDDYWWPKTLTAEEASRLHAVITHEIRSMENETRLTA